MTKTIPCLAAIITLLMVAAVRPEPTTPVKLSFMITNAGITVTGILEGNADINFNPDDLINSAIRATASPATIRTGITIRDKHLQQEDFFNSTQFPLMVLQSTRFRKTGRQSFAGDFDLTIKSITRPVTIVFSRLPTKSVIRYQGHFDLNRLDFSLGEKSMVLDEGVRINLEAMERRED